MHQCTCSDSFPPVCPRCGGTRQSRDPVGGASEGVASMRLADVTRAPPTCDREAPPTPAADDNDHEKGEAERLQRLHSASEVTATRPAVRHQHRSYSLLHDTPADVGGVSARSAPDTAVPLRPAPAEAGPGQRSRLQRFFEPLKRSKSTGNHKDTIAAAQASLSDPTRQQLPVRRVSWAFYSTGRGVMR